jgi:hypothetical protein
MKTQLTLFCVMSVLLVRAQISFNRTDYGKDGDLVLYAVDSPASGQYNYGATGPNYTWRFNTRKMFPRRFDSTRFTTVTVNPNAPLVPANLLLAGALSNQYQEVTDAFIKTIFDYPQYRINGVKLLLCNFPLTYQSSSVDSTTATTKGVFSEFGLDPIQGFDSIRFNARIQLKSDCDGWGTIVLPDSSSYNALRLKSSLFIDADIYIHSILGWTYLTNKKQTNANYAWYAKGSKSSLANVVLDTSGNYSSFTYKVQSIPQKVAPVSLISVTPDTIYQGDTVTITVRGRNTRFMQGSITYFYINSSCTINSIQVINDTLLTATVCTKYSSFIGNNSIQIKDPVAGYITLYNSFTILASPKGPKLQSLAPNFGNKGQTIEMQVTGQNTHFTKGLQASFNLPAKGGLFLQSHTVINDSLFTCTVLIDPFTDTSSFTLYVNNTVDGSLLLNGIFKVVTTGINESITQSGIRLHPNPASSVLNITLPSSSKEVLIRICDITGKEFTRQYAQSGNLEIDVSSIPSGLYQCSVIASGLNLNQKLFICH